MPFPEAKLGDELAPNLLFAMPPLLHCINCIIRIGAKITIGG